MKTLVVCTTKNKFGKKDGAEFLREATLFSKLHNGQGLYYKSEAPWTRRRLCEQFFRSAGELGGPVDAVAFFGHGGSRDLYCSGHSLRHIPKLADALRSCLRHDRECYVLLFACLTGKGFGFADKLDEALEARGLNVKTISHTTAGHVDKNPNTEDSGEGAQCRGVDLIPRGSQLWPAWVRKLRDDPVFRVSFWTMSQAQLESEIGGTPVPRMPPLPKTVKNQV